MDHTSDHTAVNFDDENKENDRTKNDDDIIEEKDDVIKKPHNGKEVSYIAVSPKGDYVITYSKIDKSIIGWNVRNHPSSNDVEKVQSDDVKENYSDVDNGRTDLRQRSDNDAEEEEFFEEDHLKVEEDDVSEIRVSNKCS